MFYMMNATAKNVWYHLQSKFPNQFEFKRKTLHDIAAELGYGTPQYKDLIADEFKVRKGLYNFSSLSPIAGKVIEKPATLSLAKKIDKEIKKSKKFKSDRTWQGKKIIDADGDFVEVDTKGKSEGNFGTVYTERDGVGYCYRNGEVVHTFAARK